MHISRCGNDPPSDLGHYVKELELRLRQGDHYLIRWDHHTVGGQLQQGAEADHFKLTLIKGDDHSVFGTEDPGEFNHIASLLEAVSHMEVRDRLYFFTHAVLLGMQPLL